MHDGDTTRQLVGLQSAQRPAQIAGRQADCLHQRLHRDGVDGAVGEMQQRQQAQIGLAEHHRLLRRRPGLRQLRHARRVDIAGHVRGAMAAERHGRHHQAEIRTIAAHHHGVGSRCQHLRDLADTRRAFLQHDDVRMPHQPQQVVPMQVRLHARGVVVDADRQVHRIGAFGEIGLDVVLGGADISGGGEDRAIGAGRLGVPQVLDRRGGGRPGAAVEELHAAVLHGGRLLADRPPFLGRQHRDLAGRSHDEDGGGAIGRMPVEQRAEGAEIDAAIGVEGGDESDEGALDTHLRHVDPSWCGATLTAARGRRNEKFKQMFEGRLCC